MGTPVHQTRLTISLARGIRIAPTARTIHAVAESFFGTLKNELVHHQTYHTRDEASREIFAFIEEF